MNHILMPALLLDFDGTIRRTKSGKAFISSIEDIELMPGIEKILWIYRKMGFLIFGVSNQGGVAHGYKTTNEVELEMERTLGLFQTILFMLLSFATTKRMGIYLLTIISHYLESHTLEC